MTPDRQMIEEFYNSTQEFPCKNGVTLRQVCDLALAALEMPEYARPDLCVLLSWIRGLANGDPVTSEEIRALLKEQLPRLVAWIDSYEFPPAPHSAGK